LSIVEVVALGPRDSEIGRPAFARLNLELKLSLKRLEQLSVALRLAIQEHQSFERFGAVGSILINQSILLNGLVVCLQLLTQHTAEAQAEAISDIRVLNLISEALHRTHKLIPCTGAASSLLGQVQHLGIVSSQRHC